MTTNQHYIGTTVYGNRVTLPGITPETSPAKLFRVAERLGVVQIENHLGDVFQRKGGGRWVHSFTRRRNPEDVVT